MTAITGWMKATIKAPAQPNREIEAFRHQAAAASGYTPDWIEIRILRSGPCATCAGGVLNFDVEWRVREPGSRP